MTSDLTTDNITQYEPEELHADAQIQYLACYYVEEMMRKGWIEERKVLEPKERTWIRKKLIPSLEREQAKGRVVFTDGQLEAAIMYVVYKMGINVKTKHFHNLMQAMKGE